MADYSEMKSEILDRLPTNDSQEITAAILRGVLDDMLDVINETKDDSEGAVRISVSNEVLNITFAS